MHYVYLLRSESYPQQTYVGLTSDLEARIRKHNHGEFPHTSKYKPWSLVTFIAFTSKGGAVAFERYLKTGSGRAFAKRHLW